MVRDICRSIHELCVFSILVDAFISQHHLVSEIERYRRHSGTHKRAARCRRVSPIANLFDWITSLSLLTQFPHVNEQIDMLFATEREWSSGEWHPCRKVPQKIMQEWVCKVASSSKFFNARNPPHLTHFCIRSFLIAHEWNGYESEARYKGFRPWRRTEKLTHSYEDQRSNSFTFCRIHYHCHSKVDPLLMKNEVFTVGKREEVETK